MSKKNLRLKNKRAIRRIERELARAGDGLLMRFVQRAASSGQVVVATETPVERFDEDRGYVIREVLLMSGCEFRGGRRQIPIVDSHDDRTVRNIFGSVQSLEVDSRSGELYGTPAFAGDEDAQTIAQRLNEGHITDFSITARPLDGVFVPPGESYRTERGEVIEGPANIVTRWEPHNASICATGADVNSTVRRSYTDLNRKVERMEGMEKTLSALGVPEDIMQDQNAVIAFLAGKLAPPDESPVADAVENMDEAEPPPVEEVENMDAEEEVAERKDATEADDVARSATEAERNRVKEIYAVCKQGRLERAFADQLVSDGVSLDEARAKVIERMAKSQEALGKSADSQPKVTESADDKFYAAARDGLISRAFRSAGIRQRPFEQAAPGAEEFANRRLSRIAEDFALRMGAPVQRMAPKDIALVAMGHPGSCNRYHIQRDAYHTTGSFPNLMLDASNKSLLAAYEEAPYTWSRWARQANSVDDFRNINRIRYSEMGSPEMVPENQNYPESKTSDQKESYKVAKYGSVFSVTWETVVNDDLDALSRTPAMQGAACRRKQNAVVYSVLTDNASLSDGGALFNSTAQTTSGGHENLATGTGAPAVATLNAGFTSMMTKKGIGSDGTDSSAILNIQPSFLIVPAALSATAMQLIGSIADPTQSSSTNEDADRAAHNANTVNIYGPNGSRPLEVIAEPVLDGNSTSAWYLAASPMQVDTVELTFLAGEESPVLESEWDFDKDVYKYKVRQTFAAAAIDFRGLYKNAG